MAKFKKNFWSGKGPEPDWYNQNKEGLTCTMGSFRDDPLFIPMQKMTGYALNGEKITFERAFSLYSSYERLNKRIPFPKVVFISSIQNGSTFQTHLGEISKL